MFNGEGDTHIRRRSSFAISKTRRIFPPYACSLLPDSRGATAISNLAFTGAMIISVCIPPLLAAKFLTA